MTSNAPELFRLFRHEQSDPAPFYERLAEISVASIRSPLAGARVLDIGSGPGYFTRRLADAGASVVGMDFNAACLPRSGHPGATWVAGSAGNLPFADASIDGVFTSNVLEHVSDPVNFFSEIERVLRPGGWAWVSWTTWFSPWGGHELSPFHYLGARMGPALHRRVRSYPLVNIPGVSLFPRHISSMLRLVSSRPGLRIVDAVPRYYPRQRWIMRVPLARELLAWNCLLYIERVETRDAGSRAVSPAVLAIR